jgi:hypothetical protein
MGSRSWRSTALLSAAAIASAALAGCGGSPIDESPVETVRHFLEVMERGAADETALREAYRLLDASARAALVERAERASTLARRRYEPWQMLAQGRFRLLFAPTAPGGMREQVRGERAFVTVSGGKPGERAEVPLVREQGRWRIVLPIPKTRSEVRPADGSQRSEG